MDELTLEKFEEASEIVKQETLGQSWCTVNIFLHRQETGCILSRKICSIQEPTR